MNARIRSIFALLPGVTASALLCALLAVALAGCAAKQFEYHSATEIPEGPGMLTGKEGAVVLYRTKKAEDSPAVRSRAHTSAPATASQPPRDDREFREFQEFKRWKESSRDTPEYREFKEWQEWRAYRLWKERNERARQTSANSP